MKMMLGLENRDLEHQVFRGETMNYSLRSVTIAGWKESQLNSLPFGQVVDLLAIPAQESF